MPRMDKTGPRGEGPQTGRGAGFCSAPSDINAARFGMGRGFGRLMTGWFCGKYQTMSKKDKKDLLMKEIDNLKQEIQSIEEELKNIDE